MVPHVVIRGTKWQCGGNLFVHWVYVLVVALNFAAQIYVCFAALTNNNAVWLWEIEVVFGVQCAAMGALNALLLLILNDDRCAHFQCLLTPRALSLCTFIVTAVAVTMTIFHGYFSGTHFAEYEPYPWGLWVLYLCLVALCALSVAHCAYYWWRGKTLPSGTPFVYTEGPRECTAIAAMACALCAYLMTAVNGYLVHALSLHLEVPDDYVLAFEVLHVLTLAVLAAVTIMVRRFDAKSFDKCDPNNVGTVLDSLEHRKSYWHHRNEKKKKDPSLVETLIDWCESASRCNERCLSQCAICFITRQHNDVTSAP